MTTDQIVTALVSFLLSAGGIGSIRIAFRGLKRLRGGARQLEREVYADIAKSLASERQDREWAEADRDCWRDVAGRWRFQLRDAGIMPDPDEVVPPSTLRPTRVGRTVTQRGVGDP